MLMYSAMFYFFGSVIFITSITPVLCCRHTTTPNNTEDQNTTDNLNITTRDWNVTTDDLNVTTDEGNVTTDDGNLTTDDVNVTTDEGNVTTDDMNITTDDGNFTTNDVNVTTDEGNVTTDDGNLSTDDMNVTTDDGNFTTDDVNVTTDDGNLTTDDGNTTNAIDGYTTQILRDSCMLLAPNDYIDELIDKLKNKIIDSIPLPDNPGSISLKEGKAWGLSTLERVGNATVHCNETITIIEVLLSFQNLTGRYTWERSVLLTKLSGFVFVKAETTKILFRVSQERVNNIRITLEELSIKEMSGIKTDITGAGLVTWALSLVTEPAANLFKKSLANIIEGPLKDAIALALRDIDVPLN